MGRTTESIEITPVENERDEADILANQDETGPASIDTASDKSVGPGEMYRAADSDDFVRGEVDVKEQMDRATRDLNFPNRAAHVKHH